MPALRPLRLLLLLAGLTAGASLPPGPGGHPGVCPNQLSPNLWVDAQSTCERECVGDQVSTGSPPQPGCGGDQLLEGPGCHGLVGRCWRSPDLTPPPGLACTAERTQPPLILEVIFSWGSPLFALCSMLRGPGDRHPQMLPPCV